MHSSIYLQQSTAFTLLEVYIFGEKLLQNSLKEVLRKDDINNLIDICAVYWHFLLVVWLVLFGLMLSS